MFTGIVEEIGTLKNISHSSHGSALEIQASLVVQGSRIGDSIAHNGICLTITRFTSSGYLVDVSPQTIRHTSLAQLRAGERINLERALAFGSRLGGHLVQGHVDDVGKVATIRREANAVVVGIQAERELMAGIVSKGSIAVDGISLTVASLFEDSFEISLIPHTYAMTNLSDRKIGDLVNLEVDIIGKYVARLMSLDASKKNPVMTEAFLRKCGY